ncbi:DUF448 domain-containing protein [Helicobacter anseris]|uniref:DUF448 domain-containing protein n=1 Tax=Helicobacter anseris TaxID=375926 RepID=A0A3D8JBR5_9HELI|nr:DUF448 domain-containing protein [Helicobacter anseris]RDU74605.1 DUF448 domain-containing protein [Helicobacter anseris]
MPRVIFEKDKPIRMCVVCRTRFIQRELIRLKVLNEKLVFFDGFGRSIYLCVDCLGDLKVHHKLQKLKQISKDKEQLYLNIQEIREKCQIK